MSARNWPTKRCDDPKKHEPHQWDLGGGWKRNCPGRRTNKRTAR